jgi:hypothetical protein
LLLQCEIETILALLTFSQARKQPLLVGKVLLHLLNQLGLLACSRLANRLQEILQRRNRRLSQTIKKNPSPELIARPFLIDIDHIRTKTTWGVCLHLIQLVVVIFVFHVLLQRHTA